MDVMAALHAPRIKRALCIVTVIGILLTGCSAGDLQSLVEQIQVLISPPPSPSPPPPPATPTPTPTPDPTATPASRGLVLRFWIPDFLDPASETTGAALLVDQVSDFTRISTGIQVEMLVKKASGAGGLYDLLSTASVVAPSVVPDLLVLNRQDLLAAVGEGLVQPLDDFMPPDAGYFDAALSDVRISETLWAFPYFATAEQMAYRTTVTTTPPITWTGVLSNSVSLILPGAPQEAISSDMLLAMYIGAGGRTVDPNGQATLNRPVLEQVYAFILDAQNAGLLVPEQVLAFADTAACWQAFQQSTVGLSPVSVGTFWRAYKNTPEDAEAFTATPAPEVTATPSPVVALLPADTQPTWVPTASGEPIAVMRTWGLAIVTQDPARRDAALELLRWLVSAQQMGDLTSSAGLTPTRRQAVEAWDLPAAEEDFVVRLLSNSVPAPAAGADLVVRRALQAGLSAILQGEATTPDAAASQALTNLRR